MAGYRILSTDPGPRCPKGNEHIEKASISNGIKNESVSGGELYKMQKADDTFVVVTEGLSELDWPSGQFDACGCGAGYVLKFGKSAVELTREAREGR